MILFSIRVVAFAEVFCPLVELVEDVALLEDVPLVEALESAVLEEETGASTRNLRGSMQTAITSTTTSKMAITLCLPDFFTYTLIERMPVKAARIPMIPHISA